MMDISLTVVLLSFICVFFLSIHFRHTKKNTTTTINIQRDCKKIFYLDFILNASSSLLCYASIALCSLFFFTTHTHTHVHSLHTPFVGQKKGERGREREWKKNKTAYRQITMLIVEQTSIYPPTMQMCALSLLSVVLSL